MCSGMRPTSRWINIQNRSCWRKATISIQYEIQQDFLSPPKSKTKTNNVKSFLPGKIARNRRSLPYLHELHRDGNVVFLHRLQAGRDLVRLFSAKYSLFFSLQNWTPFIKHGETTMILTYTKMHFITTRIHAHTQRSETFPSPTFSRTVRQHRKTLAPICGTFSNIGRVLENAWRNVLVSGQWWRESSIRFWRLKHVYVREASIKRLFAVLCLVLGVWIEYEWRGWWEVKSSGLRDVWKIGKRLQCTVGKNRCKTRINSISLHGVDEFEWIYFWHKL